MRENKMIRNIVVGTLFFWAIFVSLIYFLNR